MQKYDYYSFFDVDGTITNFKTMFSFLKFFENAKGQQFDFEKSISNLSRKQINERYYQLFKGIDILELELIGLDWFKLIINTHGFNRPVLEEISFHKKKNAGIVFVSGSFMACLKPLAQYVGATHILCTQQIAVNGILTGNINWPQTIGEGKVSAIENFCINSSDEIDLNLCHAYGDHITDIFMLEMIGFPCVIKGDPELEKIAKTRNWRMV